MAKKSTVDTDTLEAYILLKGEIVRVRFTIDDELSGGELVGVVVQASNGLDLVLWAQVELTGREVVLRQMYFEQRNAGDGSVLGMRSALAQAAMEVFDVDRIRIEGARRTSGIRPGRIVRTFVFER
jgi:hypothetical protein